MTHRILLLAAAFSFIAHAATITNGTYPADLNAGGLVLNTFEGAEYFDLPVRAAILSIQFVDEEYPPSGHGPLDYFIYDNNGFFPGNLLASGQNVPLTQTFVFNGGSLSVSTLLDDFDLFTPVVLDPGRYWVGLNFRNTVQSLSWFSTTTPNAQLSAGTPAGTNNWNLDAVQLYLGVTYTTDLAAPTPEPATLALAGLGLIAFGCSRFRSR
jgi:hypothetical protein